MSSSNYALRDGMPRIYCKDHFNYRYDDGEGSGYMTKARLGRSAKS